MEENINDRIRKYIIKHIVGKIGYSQETQSFQLLLRQMRTADRILFREEIRKYESWQNMTENNIDKFIDDVRLSAGLCNKTRRTTYPSLMLDNIAEGNIISLYEYDDRQGESHLRLLYMGKNDLGIQRFFVISSNRTALHPEDILEPYGSNIWSVDHSAVFRVYRNGERIPQGKDLLYLTYPLRHISLETPSIVHEVIDARNDFTYEEYVANKSTVDKLHLSFTRPSMGLLLHEYSTKMDFYADFIDEGINCKFETNIETQYSVIDRIRYFCDVSESEAKTKHLKTSVPGSLRMDNETMELKLLSKIKC